MKWEVLLQQELDEVDLKRHLSYIPVKDLKEAIAAAELEIKQLEAEIAGLKTKKTALKETPWGDLYLETDFNKVQLFSQLKKLNQKKASLAAEKAALRMDISKFRVKSTKSVSGKGSIMHGSISNLMDMLPQDKRGKFKELESETLYRVAVLTEEGFSPDEAYEIVSKGLDPSDVLDRKINGEGYEEVFKDEVEELWADLT